MTPAFPPRGLLLLFVFVLAVSHSPLSAQEPSPSATVAERFAKGSDEGSDEGSGGNGHPPDFQRHVMPLLGKLGCNGRACHGSFQGRGGLALSLFGYDFSRDHAALTGPSSSGDAMRVDRGDAVRSLILRKPSGQLDHEGGQRLQGGSWQYRLLSQWIRAGAPAAAAKAKLLSLKVTPDRLAWKGTGSPAQPLRVVAIWSDGTQEDVTPLARFRSNDSAVAIVDDHGRVTPQRGGDTHIIAFYDNGVAAVPVLVADSTRQQVAWPADANPTPVDRLVNANLRALGIVPSGLCSDAEFLRRASIDLTGTLPTPAEITQFLADPAPDKREKKIDELLERPACAAWWATKLCDFTGCNPQQQAELGQETAEQWYMWIYQRLRENAPYDEIVEGILLATSRGDGQDYRDYAEFTSGHFREEDATSFSQRATMPHFWSRRTLEQSAERGLAVAHSFMGIRLQCAQCHKHPWDRWTQQDFQQFSKFFDSVRFGIADSSRQQYREVASRAGIDAGRDQGRPIRDRELALARKGKTLPWREVYLELPSEPVTLKLLQSLEVTVRAGEDPRSAVMRWMRSPDNPWFARAFVNRVWASCFHAGIVEPPDDLNPANPPSNPLLLDWLAGEFVRHDYDIRWLLKEITRSAAWQRSFRPNATNRDDKRHFSRAIPRRLPAEVVYDAIKQAVCAGDQQQHVRSDLTRRAVGHLSMRMAGTYAMDVFGKPKRAAACDCERVNEPSLLQAVFLQNDPLMHLLLEESGWLKEIRKVAAPDRETLRGWVHEAWLRVLSRPPSAAEVARALAHFEQAEAPGDALEDLLWSLLNTKEFLLNH